MSTNKKFFAVLIAIFTLCFSILTRAETEEHIVDKAEKLYSLGLLKGTGTDENGEPVFELDRAATRAEGIVMLIRYLGKETEAINHSKTHPFTDVPEWADGYVSYAYDNGLTNGISENLFGAKDNLNVKMYKTLVLRALGYSDGENGDFTWDNPNDLARAAGISDNTYDSEFSRGDMIDIAYSALFSYVKATDVMLYEKLISEGVLKADDFERVFANMSDKPNDYDVLLSKKTSELTRFSDIFYLRDGYALLGFKDDNAVMTMIYDNDRALIKRENPIAELPMMSKTGESDCDEPDEIWASKHGLQLYYTYVIESDIADGEGVMLYKKGKYKFTFDVHYGTVKSEFTST